MTQGYDPNNPQSPAPNQAPLQQQGAPEGADALGFSAAPKAEKYNTQYLAGNLQKSQMTNKLIIVGAVVAAALGVLTWVSLMPESAPTPTPKDPTPAAAVDAEGTAEPEKLAEGNDAEGDAEDGDEQDN